MKDPLKPSVQLLAKIGSLAVHADEVTSEGNHQFDVAAIRSLLADAEVITWLKQMSILSLVTLKRSKP